MNRNDTKTRIADMMRRTHVRYSSFFEKEKFFHDNPNKKPIELKRYYEGLHDYIDIHISELAKDHYSILELIAIHDAIDTIILSSLIHDDVLKEKVIIYDIIEHRHLKKMSWGYHYLHLMSMIFTDVDDDYALVKADDIIRTIFYRAYECGLFNGVRDFDFKHASRSIALSYAKLTGKVVYPEYDDELKRKLTYRESPITSLSLKYLNLSSSLNDKDRKDK